MGESGPIVMVDAHLTPPFAPSSANVVHENPLLGKTVSNEGVLPSTIAMGVGVPPPKLFSFIGGYNFSRVSNSVVAHPPKGKSHPLACAKISPIVVCGQDVVDNVEFDQ